MRSGNPHLHVALLFGVLVLAPSLLLGALALRHDAARLGVVALLLVVGLGAVLVLIELRRAARLTRLKTDFISSVSHELRTPLTSIRMYSEMLDVGGEEVSRDERARYLKTMRRECDRLRRLIDAVLDFTHMERGTKRYTFEYEEIGALVRSVGEDFREQAEAAGFAYRIDVGDDLPEMRVDADALRQMLFNLLSNAVQYAEDERDITLRTVLGSRELALQVEDHGIGIEPRERERIFRDFYRADDARVHGGVGLGLTIARRIAEAHGGRLVVDSVRGRGSTFTAWLPLPRADDTVPQDRATGTDDA